MRLILTNENKFQVFFLEIDKISNVFSKFVSVTICDAIGGLWFECIDTYTLMVYTIIRFYIWLETNSPTLLRTGWTHIA